MKHGVLALLILVSPFVVSAQTSTVSSSIPSVQFIAQIKAQMLSDPAMAALPPERLDMLARQVATQIVRSDKAPPGLISTSTPRASQNATSTTSGLTNCFDYYHFGSVQAKLDANVQSAIAGSSVTFSGVLENSNPYPVVDGTLYVKIFRYPKGEFDTRNGPDVVDQFVAIDGISIPANGSIPATYTWKVPAYTQSGDYGAAMYYTTEHKFNLLGLTFTDDVTGNTTRFKVAGEQQTAVTFLKDSVTVNNAAYYFAEFPPHASSTGDVSIVAKIGNSSDQTQSVPILWQLYSWDSQLPGNLIAESSDTVSVPARGAVPLTYTIQDTSVPVYLLVGTASWHGTKSIIGVRVVRDGINKLRINFPSTAIYPLQGGQENTLFSCLHNTSDGVVQGAKLDLRVLDPAGNEIGGFSYEGAVGGNMMAVARKFTPKKSYETFSLEAKLYQDGRLVDEATVHYDCKAIDPASCPKSNYMLIIIEILAGIVLVGGSLAWYLRSRQTV